MTDLNWVKENPKQAAAKIDKVKRLLKEAYNHLDYCGWGDSWEWECSEGLRQELTDYFEYEKGDRNYEI